MKTAYLFPGQGVQFPGMGKGLYDNNAKAKALFETANDFLGFRITDIMFEGTREALQQTRVTQPAIFLHSVIAAKTTANFLPTMVAGHSLGELSALTATQILSFEDGLHLVVQRAKAMQAACEKTPGAMAAVLGLSDESVEKICAAVEEFVVPVNYNCPGQLVISGTQKGVALAREAMQAAGSTGVVLLPVSGGFHSALMKPARELLKKVIQKTTFRRSTCPVYQNVNAIPTTEPEIIQENLLQQLTSPVQWTQTIRRMIKDGAQHFVICGPSKVLQRLVRKIDSNVLVTSLASTP